MRMRVALAAAADDAYRGAPPGVQDWADKVFDWLEEDPVNPHARRHRFSQGLYYVAMRSADQDWALLWEPEGETAFVQYLGLWSP